MHERFLRWVFGGEENIMIFNKRGIAKGNNKKTGRGEHRDLKKG